jgi:hypothetical protein
MEQTIDLIRTIEVQIIASEFESRPKDYLTPTDDTMNKNWSPEKEKQMFGDDDYDEREEGEEWKR